MGGDYGPRMGLPVGSLALAAALLAVLVVGGGWLTVRGLTAPSTPAPSVSGPRVEPDVLAFGAPEVVDGVPWGFPLTADGAAAAAVTAVAVTGQQAVVFDPDRYAEVARVVFSPEQIRVQGRRLEAVRVQFDQQGWHDAPPSRRTYHFAVLAVAPSGFDPTGPSATVDVWSMTLVGVGDHGGAVFATSTVDLQADPSGQTWQVTGLESSEGPVPLVDAPASAPGRTRMLLRDATVTVPLPVGTPQATGR